jgi:DNA-binding cell septation regulator SpoVG
VRARDIIFPIAHTRKEKTNALLAKYEKKKDVDKQRANLKIFGNNGAADDNRD